MTGIFPDHSLRCMNHSVIMKFKWSNMSYNIFVDLFLFRLIFQSVMLNHARFCLLCHSLFVNAYSLKEFINFKIVLLTLESRARDITRAEQFKHGFKKRK